METGMPIPNLAPALQNHFLAKVSKLKMAILVPISLFRLNTPLATEFPLVNNEPLHGTTPKGTNPTELVGWVPPPPIGAYAGVCQSPGCILQGGIQP